MDILEGLTLGKLFKAYFDCRRNKRNTHSALEFEFDLEKNLLDLYHDLKNETYQIGQSICFVVTKPKPREVWAANFRDRIVHHLIYNEISERFYRRFIKDTYSCIPKKGTLAAVKRVRHFANSITQNYTKNAYYLKADISNFFGSIDKKILFNQLKSQIHEAWILNLVEKVLFHDPKNNVYMKSSKEKIKLIPYKKSLWNAKENVGLPIGNLTSQFFSNVYLDGLDAYIKNVLRCKYYIRYVDDFVILAKSVDILNSCFEKIDAYLIENCSQGLHPRKKLINKLSVGVDFVGFVIKPGRILLRKKTIRRAFMYVKKFKYLKNFCNAALLDFANIINSYIAMLRATKGFRIRQIICEASANLFLSFSSDYSVLQLVKVCN